jgi:hypothetical protein
MEFWRQKKKNKEEKDREKYNQRNGYASEEIERLRAEGRWMNAELSEKGQRLGQAKERIKESRCNREYERCMTEEIAKYLGRKSRRERKMMVRF